MKLLNRAGFSLLPRQPFVEWVQQLPAVEDGQQMTLAEHQQEGTLYLIDEVDSEAAFEQALQQHWQTMFENELASWDEFGDYWPSELTRSLFDSWFELRPQIMTLDLSSQPLMTASLLQE
ncbi:MAG: hypothetical protein OIF57_09770 [Marinobacterium sp.]|nr:hypothetical protein [Marinobacterium sp.]